MVSPRDIVVARPRDLDDHMGWLLERGRYEEALQAAEANEAQLRDHNLQDIGQKYIEVELLDSQYLFCTCTLYVVWRTDNCPCSTYSQRVT